MISEQAIVKTKKIGTNAVIHPFSVISEDVTLGNDVIIHPNAVIGNGVVICEGVEVFPGAFIGKEPKGAGATARIPEFTRKIIIGANSSIGPNSVIYYDVIIGNNCLIGDGASIREKVSIGEYCIISRYVTINYNVKIGSRTKIMDLTHITGNCEIGNDVFISLHVSTTNDKLIGAQGYEEERVIGPKIRDGAMIGVGANILPGVEVGMKSIVGANALVNKDVPPEKMVIGCPARVIKDLTAKL